MLIHFASDFYSRINKIFSRLSLVCSCNFFCKQNANFFFSTSSLGNSCREFLRFFHFNRRAKSKGLKRSNQLLFKLNFKEKFFNARKLNPVSFFLRSKCPHRFLQTKCLQQIKIWEFVPCGAISQNGKMLQFFMGIQANIQKIVDQPGRMLCLGYVINVYGIF